MWKTELKFGIIGGLTLCAFKAIEYLPMFQVIRLDTGIYTGLFAFVIIIAVIVLAVKIGRSDEDAVPFTFYKALRIGVIITVIMALIATPFMYVYTKYINPNEAEKMVRHLKVNLGADDLAPTKEQIQAIYTYYKPWVRTVHTLGVVLLTGSLISLLSAGMFSKQAVKLDLEQKEKMPSIINKLFLAGLALSFLPILVYISLVLKAEDITTLMFDFIVEPINDRILQFGTAFFAISAVIANILVYNRISHYFHRRHRVMKLWSVLMIIVCGMLFSFP